MGRQEPYDATLQMRRKIYMEISQLLAKLVPPSQASLTQDELRAINIKCSAMALRPEEDSNHGPSFCKLVSPGTMNKAFDSAFTSDYDLDWPGYDPDYGTGFYAAYAIGGTLLDYTVSGQLVREPLVDTEWYTVGLEFEFDFIIPRLTKHFLRDYSKALSLHRHWYPDLYGQWGICDILRLNNTQQPHLACLHIDYALTEDGLHPSEVVSEIKLIKQGMRLDKRGKFRIYPVRIRPLRLSFQIPDRY